MSIEYVIFDMDGLLIDTESLYTVVTNKVLSRFGLEMTWEIKSKLMGMPAIPSTLTLFNSFPPGSIPTSYTPEIYLEERNALLDEMFRACVPMPGALALIQTLSKRGVPIAVATGSSQESFDLKTGHLAELFDLFEGKILTSTTPPVPPATKLALGKPSPEIFLAAARRLGYDVGVEEEATKEHLAERAKGLVFEDALPGVQAGHRAGMSVIWIPDPQLKKMQGGDKGLADEILSSLEEFNVDKWLAQK